MCNQLGLLLLVNTFFPKYAVLFIYIKYIVSYVLAYFGVVSFLLSLKINIETSSPCVKQDFFKKSMLDTNKLSSNSKSRWFSLTSIGYNHPDLLLTRVTEWTGAWKNTCRFKNQSLPFLDTVDPDWPPTWFMSYKKRRGVYGEPNSTTYITILFKWLTPFPSYFFNRMKRYVLLT